MFFGDDSEYVPSQRRTISADHNGHHRGPLPHAPDNPEHNFLLVSDGKIATRDVIQRYSSISTLESVPDPSVGIFYGQLMCDPYWDPLRKDPRFEKLLAQLAPNQSLKASGGSSHRTRKPSVRSGPKKISVARLPVTGSDLFGREEDIAFLDRAWANQQVNVVSIVAWGGVGKSTLVNHWLRRMAAENYRSAQLVFGWSFYRQGTGGDTSSAGEFLDAALH